eukprot:349763-Chlamydomonas_euryale.AAC.6
MPFFHACPHPRAAVPSMHACVLMLCQLQLLSLRACPRSHAAGPPMHAYMLMLMSLHECSPASPMPSLTRLPVPRLLRHTGLL